LGTDPDLGDLVDMFVEEMPQRAATLRDSWERADWESFGRAAHQLKGAAGSYGFSDLTPCLTRLDAGVKNRSPEDEIAQLLDEVLDACSRVRGGAPE